MNLLTDPCPACGSIVARGKFSALRCTNCGTVPICKARHVTPGGDQLECVLMLGHRDHHWGRNGVTWDDQSSAVRAVLYLAHPVTGDVPGNLAKAKRWLRWAQTAFATCAVIAPWIAWIDLGDDDGDPAVRERGLQRDEAVVSRCDAILLVGGRVSTGMAREAKAAKATIDLTVLGEEPPA